MDKLVIRGGRRLRGAVEISGSKNAALPIMAATLLAPGEHYIENVPHLRDVSTMGRLLANLGELQGIPAILINGRYDMAAPCRAAYLVHQGLPGSKLVIVEEAGHSESENGITAALLEATSEFEPKEEE